MAVYAEKKNGQLTGRFRVELQRGTERYRKRWDSYAEAKVDEDRVLKLWDQGIVNVSSPDPRLFSRGVTLAEGMVLGEAHVWRGKSTEETCWARMRTMKGILGPNIFLDNIDTVKVDDMALKLEARGLSDATINRYLSHLRTFLVWCKRRKHRAVPIDEIEFAWRGESVGRIRWITYEEEKAAEEFLLGRGRPEAEAVWDTIDIALETGCRRDEILTAELDQINGHRLHLWETKTDTPRTVPMSPRIAEKLVNLIKSNRMPTRRNLRSWWQRLREHMGLLEDEDFVFHACRHTRATRMVDAGINVFVIKEWMGHKRIETTLRYAHVRPQNLEEALVKVGEFEAGLRLAGGHGASGPLRSPYRAFGGFRY